MKKTITRTGNIYIQESVRNGNKVTSRTVKKLGKVSSIMKEHSWTEQQVMDWIDEQVALLNDEKKNNPGKSTIILSASEKLAKGEGEGAQIPLNMGYLFIQSILSSLGLPKILDRISESSKTQFDLNSITSLLVYDRIIHPSPKLGAFHKKNRFLEPFDFDLHQVYRALDLLGDRLDEIQQELFKSTSKAINRNTDVLYYDCTNFFFETEEADPDRTIADENGKEKVIKGDRQYGQSKENRPNPIVQLGLFVDANGIPIRFSVFPGSQSEQVSIDEETFKEIHRKYKIGSFIYCSDAGLASSKIKKSLNSYAFPSYYIVSQSLKKMKGSLQKRCLDEYDKDENGNPSQKKDDQKPVYWKYQKFDETLGRITERSILFKDIDQSPENKTVYYHEVWHQNHLNGDKPERLIVTYQPVYANYQKRIREEQIKRGEKKAASGQKGKGPNDPARFFREVKVTADGEVAECSFYELDQEKIDNEARFDGFYCMSTNLEDEHAVSQIMKISKLRWQIEAAFRIMKTDLESRPVYVHTPNRIRAHFLICFLALLVVKILETVLEKKFTVPEILETLKGMQAAKIVGNQGYLPVFVRTDLTDSLTEKFNLPLDRQFITSPKMNQLIARTKKTRKLATIGK